MYCVYLTFITQYSNIVLLAAFYTLVLMFQFEYWK